MDGNHVDIRKSILIYDDECGMCRAVKDWTVKRVRADGLETLSAREAALDGVTPGLDATRLQQSIWVVLPDGRRYGGAEALPKVIGHLRGWRWMVPLFSLPGVLRLADWVYRLVSRNRYVLSRCEGRDGCAGRRKD